MGNLTTAEGIPNTSGNPTLPQPQSAMSTVATSPPDTYTVFPYKNAESRLSDYEYFNNLLLGQHFEAFNIRVNSKDYTKDYAKLRYITANFAGLISKISADMLFSEPMQVKAPENGDQDFLDALWFDNKMNEQLYESAVSNSALGDALFKVRAGKRHPNDENSTIIIEDFTPTIYFPNVDGFNVRSTPKQIELAWTFKVASTLYLRKEIHTPGQIEYHVYEMKENKIMQEVNLDLLGDPNLTGVGMVQDTGIDRYLIVHIPNWKTGNRHFGISDYYDLDKLFYALNNRITKVDNILDKHSDPILMVPEGILDEKGNVKKESLHMIEVPEGGDNIKAEYIVWNANLEAAFTQLEKLMDYFMMTAEITPDILGMGQGLNDSGRALKFKLMRTIAKSLRKKLYYDRGIKEVMFVAQLLAKEWDLGVGPDNLKLTGDPQMVDLLWQDGLPIDDYEEVTNEIAKIDAGIQSKRDAIMNLDNLDEEAAEEKLEEIDEENKLAIQTNMSAMDFSDESSNDEGDDSDTSNQGSDLPSKQKNGPGIKPEQKVKTPPNPRQRPKAK